MFAQTSNISRNILHNFIQPSMEPPTPTWPPENAVNIWNLLIIRMEQANV